jgi:hypothetical protein
LGEVLGVVVVYDHRIGKYRGCQHEGNQRYADYVSELHFDSPFAVSFRGRFRFVESCAQIVLIASAAYSSAFLMSLDKCELNGFLRVLSHAD